MRIIITIDDLQAIKEYLARVHPEHRPSHRIEAAARGLGFSTYAGLREALVSGPVATEPNDLRFCAALGIPLEREGKGYNRPISRAVARIALHRVLDVQPTLTQRGFDSIWVGSSDEMKLPALERRALLAKRRTEAYESDWSFDQFELASIFLSRQQKIKSLNRRIGSYGLKHRAENLMRQFGLFKPLGNYVSNGMLIAAAFAQGFDVQRINRESYNAYLNISTVTVRQSRGWANRSHDEDLSVVAAMYGDLDRLAA